jgi:iron-sulfur cluster assembly accessory protein
MRNLLEQRRLTTAREHPNSFTKFKTGEQTVMPDNANISVSDRAANRIREIMAREAGQNALRISVAGGGCSGFRYDFEIVAGPGADDLVIEKDGARVAIDPVSVPYMAGSEIDYVDDLMGASFKIHNPNATASCGCGTSFSI